MTTLPTTFNRDGFSCTVVRREGRVALVKVGSNPAHDHHEVVVIQLIKEKQWPDGTLTPAHEAMPANSQWGTFGWSYMTRAHAEEKFNAVVKERHAREARKAPKAPRPAKTIRKRAA